MRLPGSLPATCPSSRLLYLLSWGGSLHKSSPASYQLGPQDVSASACVSLNWPEFGACEWERERDTWDCGTQVVIHLLQQHLAGQLNMQRAWLLSTSQMWTWSLDTQGAVWGQGHKWQEEDSKQNLFKNSTLPCVGKSQNHPLMSKSQKKSVIKCILE